MHTLLIVALSAHVLTTVFWAGSTFTLARMAGAGAERLFAPQLGAAAVAILSGAYLWSVLHRGSFGLNEQILAGGIGAALLALILQAAIGGRTLWAVSRKIVDAERAHQGFAIAQRSAAALLVITVVCMAVARYV